MNILFSGLLFIGILVLVFVDPSLIMPSMISGVEASVTFAIRLFAIYAIFMSILKILEKSGANDFIGKALKPITKRLFKGESNESNTYLSMNISANLLGMGGAATPMGIKAVETMQSRKNKIMLVVINSCSIQLVPTTVLAMRSGHGATTDIMLPALIVNIVTTIVGILLVKIFVRDEILPKGKRLKTKLIKNAPFRRRA